MVKFLKTCPDNLYSEQYDCSKLLNADNPPLEELDPAILSCGLPAIVLSDMQPVCTRPIRYTTSQLLALRKSLLCNRRPAAADDPIVANFAIWKRPNPLRKGCNPNGFNVNSKDDRFDGGEGMTNYVTRNRIQERPAGPRQNFLRENAFIAPRFRRNYEFSNRNQHVIVKNYRSADEQRHQEIANEEEPEWVSAGPTSRLDTIELRGFDEDTSINASSSSLEKANADAKNTGKRSEKHISFYDELHHYEHVQGKRGNGNSKQGDTSEREHDLESVATSNTNSPPPARSTPTKTVPGYNHMTGEKLNDSNHKFHQQPRQASLNMNNFEEFIKLDSLLEADKATNSSPGSRFSKWFSRRNVGNQSFGSINDERRHSFMNMNGDNFGNGSNRFQYDRNQTSQNHQQRFNRSLQADYNGASNNHFAAESNTAFNRLVDMLAQNQVNNNIIAQQQFLMQMLSKNQQTDILRRMLMKNNVENATDPQQMQQQQQQQSAQQQPRYPSQRELQFHTQSIMQNALLRKKLQDQRKALCDQNSRIAAAAAVINGAEPNAAVQQFVQSVCPNMQRSLSVLSQTANSCSSNPFNQLFPAGGKYPCPNGTYFAAKPNLQEPASQRLYQQKRAAGTMSATNS
ncbi:protein cup [Toxorhynchites rutilus septentrionalis]|uniref:protein cup n=1 Tax=Toxorhynchites rutilus septentrionalis TaxID=329112 RepID=UPI002479214F|nr:protein cup [Toxorhynchites rutilus septentrionalis]